MYNLDRRALDFIGLCQVNLQLKTSLDKGTTDGEAVIGGIHKMSFTLILLFLNLQTGAFIPMIVLRSQKVDSWCN
eukprot:11364.XXX_618922_619146_1 [CDS] Oithona nana genome sequencing.